MTTRAKHFYEFDSFRLDPDEQVLFHNGEPVSLSPKLFDTLLVLVRESGHIVEKDELIRQLWPDTFVEENNLSQYISILRRTLGDGRHEQRYIQTVPRRGYRFTANVREAWDDKGATIGMTHTRVSLALKEETQEEEDSDPPRSSSQTESERWTAFASPSRRRGLTSLAAVLMVVAAVAFYQFDGHRKNGAESLTSKAAAFNPSLSPQLPVSQAFKIKTFDPSVWFRTDAEIGVESFVIEDFEDKALVDGLQIELSDSTEDNFGPTSTLPMAFNPDINDSGGARVFVAGIWDGSRVFINRRTPPPHGYADFVWGDVTFHLPGGASAFGFSIHEMDLNTELSVNDVPLINVRRLLPSGSARGGYLRIDATPEQAIYSVKVANSANSKTGDGLAFDHVAFKPLQR